jgi:L-lactate dehydrogenase complex protein LldG
MSARAAILDRLRSARATARIPRVEAPTPQAVRRRSRADCLARFIDEASALGVECTVESSAAAVRARVEAIVQGKRVLSWDPTDLPYGVGNLLRASVSSVARGSVHSVAGSSPRDMQAAADVGITGCDAAIAETGSLAMLSAPGRSRAVSLLPPVHVAIVRPEDLCFDMAEFFESRRDEIGLRASCTFITGPSRTADIELTLTLGIHGPGRLTIIIGPECQPTGPESHRVDG